MKTTTAPTTVTAQKIHAVLRKAGVTRSTTSSTRVKGFRKTHYGYQVEGNGRFVRLNDGSPKAAREQDAWRTLDVYRIESALTDAGIKFARVEGNAAIWRVG